MKPTYSADRIPIAWALENSSRLTFFDNNPEIIADPFERRRWPKNGFIDDFYYHTIGFETTNLFAFWSAVGGLSSIFQREIHVRFGDGLFPNFYIIFVAPPAVCHKSTALTRYDKIESKMFDLTPNEALKFKRKTPVIRGKATPEQLFSSMANKAKILENGEEIETNANLVLRVSELTSLLNKSQYNMTLVDKLTDFYDCKDYDTDSTIARGTVTLKNIFATLWGATTPDALKESIPPEAFGGGFMSRCIVVQEKTASRIYARPCYPKEVPDTEEMAQRLLWLMAHKQGEYTLDKETNAYYEKWYRKNIKELRSKALSGDTDHRDSRLSIHVLKLALILAAQRYDLDHYIRIDDLKQAIDIMKFTNRTSKELIDDISISGQSNSSSLRIKSWIKAAGKEGIPRTTLMRSHSLKKAELDSAIDDLTEANLIYIERKHAKVDGRLKRTIVYHYKEAEIVK